MKIPQTTILVVTWWWASTADAFVQKTTTFVPTRLSAKQATDKPTRVDIETAAGQLNIVGLDKKKEDGQRDTTTDAVQGFMTKTENECTKYACMASYPETQKKLERITKKRPYPLFLLEKAAKIVGDILPSSSDSEIYNGDAVRKERLVILGSGWGSAALLQDIDNDRYDVTIISPRNYFLFTPLLAGSGVGTVDYRSITQPIREFNREADYLEAAATAIDPKRQVVKCTGIQGDNISEFEVEYDRLVVAVGARVNTFGIPGITENCSFLKQVDDARVIRRKIVNLFEKANYPGQSEEQLRKLLTFAVIGAGPTGVEFAAELRDFIEEDGPKYYPKLLKYVSIKLIEASSVVLRPFDEQLQENAKQVLTRPVSNKNKEIIGLFREDLTELIIDTPVKEVTADEIVLGNGQVVPYGLAVWAGGIGPLPITLQIIEAIGGMQNRAQKVARGKIAVDPWLRAVEGQGKIFALGDCVCTQNNCLPATAQVAAQEGEFLAHLLNAANLEPDYEGELMLPPKLDKKRAKLIDAVTSLAINDGDIIAPFQFLDMGILAYTGGLSALAQVQLTPQEKSKVKATGKVGFGLWRSVYFMKQASLRNRVLVFFDWMKARLFGRDITTID